MALNTSPHRLDVVSDLYYAMLRIRMIEERIADKYSQQEMRCPVHLSIGQEAAAVGVCSALRHSDWVFSGHRNHAHYLAKGGDLKAMISEIYGKSTGCCGGKGGSMHLTDRSAGFIGATPIVASTIPIALGAAFTSKYSDLQRVVTIFLGDGAMESGVIHECMNYAVTAKLPVLFVCENNLYSVYSSLEVRQPAGRSLSGIAKAHGLNTLSLDGNDVELIYDSTLPAVEDLRNGSSPYFLELSTYRWREHCGPGFDNNIGYRSQEEFEYWKNKDPLLRVSPQLDADFVTTCTTRITEEINQSFAFAEASPFASLSTSSQHVFSPSSKRDDYKPESTDRVITFAEAIRESQDQALQDNDSVYLMGLGVPDPKGIFGTTLNLQDQYGSHRVFDTPLAENTMTGVAIGSSITGLRPILTHQRLDFALVSIDQIVNQAAKWHYMFNGAMDVPIVIRMIIGRGWGQGPQHSQSLHSWFAHIPGLKVVMPSSAYDAKGMLTSAISDNNPVLFLEHRWLHYTKGYVPPERYSVPIGESFVIRKGSDLTLVGVSYMTLECIKAADFVSSYGINVEVIDLRSIQPIDTSTIYKSIGKTRRLLVVDHADACCGISSEIISLVSEKYGNSLYSNPRRICLPSHPLPTSHHLSSNYYPNANNIALDILNTFNVSTSSVIFPPDSGSHDQPNSDFIGPF